MNFTLYFINVLMIVQTLIRNLNYKQNQVSWNIWQNGFRFTCNRLTTSGIILFYAISRVNFDFCRARY